MAKGVVLIRIKESAPEVPIINNLNLIHKNINSITQNRKTSYILWGQRIYDPGPFYIKAQGLGREDIMPRMYRGSPKRPKDMAEDDLVLDIP